MSVNEKSAKNDDLKIGFAAGVAVTAFVSIPLLKMATRRGIAIGQGQVANAVLHTMLTAPRR